MGRTTNRTEEIILPKSNSFDSLRLLGSLLVLIGHSMIVSGDKAPNIGDIPLHSLGVVIFFVISGFLITQSWMSDRNAIRFLQKRALRIFPALVIVVTVTALLIGPLASSEPPSDYFRHGWTYRYILSNSVLITVWGLPGVFTTLPIAGQANGSLWTLPIEFGLYLIVPLIVFFNRAVARASIVAIIILAIAIVLAKQRFPEIFTSNLMGIDVGKGLALAPYFLIGSALRLANFADWSSNIRILAFLASAIVVVVWALFAGELAWAIAVAIFPMAILVVHVGLSDWLSSRYLRQIGDLSYGLYLWSFPMQQLIKLYFDGHWMHNLALSLPISLALAYASWHLIERTALRYKPTRLELLAQPPAKKVVQT